ncbi:MAG: MBL fold metallo-hydrolase [Pseudomonadota bacterium]
MPPCLAGVAAQVTRDVRCILAPNPSAMTGPGTNSYLLGHGAGLALIDPGPALPAHQAAILAALRPGEAISHIIVTHAHLDHSALAPAIAQATGAPVLAFGDARAGRSAVMQALATAGLVDGGEGVDHGFRPDGLLADGQRLDGKGWALTALHTPGHMGGHLCLAVGDLLFSGDHVMGWASTLVSPPDGDMGAYMASLARLSVGRWQQFLPGHGPAVADPAARLADLTRHRKAREAAILAALGGGPLTPAALAARIYTDTAPALMPAAGRNVLAHLVDLAARSLVSATPAPHPDATFALLPPV